MLAISRDIVVRHCGHGFDLESALECTDIFFKRLRKLFARAPRAFLVTEARRLCLGMCVDGPCGGLVCAMADDVVGFGEVNRR